MVVSINNIFYALNFISALSFSLKIFRSYKATKLPVSIQDLPSFITSELKKSLGSVVGFIHFSIIVGIPLSMTYIVLEPFFPTSILWSLLLILSLPLDAGLLVGIFWRVIFYNKSSKINENLNLRRDIGKDSMRLQWFLIGSIVLTLINLTLFWIPEFFILNSFIFIIRNILALKYASPFVNTLFNHNRPISRYRTPFKLKDVLEGKIDLDEVKSSVENINDFTSREKLSLKSCVEIGVCEDVCPATKVGRPLSPRVIVRKLAHLMNHDKTNVNVLDEVNKNELWACTTCGACTFSCPVNVRHLEIIMDLRRTLTESGFADKKKTDVLSSVSKYGNTFSMSNRKRLSWLTELGVKTFAQNPNCKYLLWVGCLSSFDERLREIIVAFVEILKKIGKINEIAILGEYETCCGDPVRKLGEEGLYQEVALKNIELFEKNQVDTILTPCPHCYNAFKNDYAVLTDKKIKVKHHTEFLNELFEEGFLKLNTTNEPVTVHDPCYLSRYNKIVNILDKSLGKIGDMSKPKYHGEKTFCCGGGGGNYWYEVPEKKRISHERLDQLLTSNPKTVVTSCPYCNAMLYDASQNKDVKGLEVKDIAEILRNNIFGSKK